MLKFRKKKPKKPTKNIIPDIIPAEPFYTVEEAESSVALFQSHPKRSRFLTWNFEISARYFYAGHILGACSIELNLEGKKLVFLPATWVAITDDLLFPAVKPKQADYVFLESTYGNRLHPENDPGEELAQYINEAFEKGGNIVIPSFAVERAQAVMYLIWQLKKAGKIPDMPYIIDTPMGIEMLQLFTENRQWHKLRIDQCEEMCKIFSMITDYEDTIAAIYDDKPKE